MSDSRIVEETEWASVDPASDEEELPPEVREAIYQDVYGTAGVQTYAEAEEMVNKARKELESALECIPKEENEAYTEAARKVPHLIEIESNPLAFLRHAEYDPWKAAKLLVLHWEKRKELFGDRFLLPMTLTGEGALSPADLQFLESGFAIFLPECNGRVVFLHNRARVPANVAQLDPDPCEKKLRCMFYMMMITSETGLAEQVTIQIVHGDQRQFYQRCLRRYGKYAHQVVGLMHSDIFPIRFKAIHLCTQAPEDKAPVKKFVPYLVQVLKKWRFMKLRTVVHMEATEPELFESLSKYGFEKQGLPGFLGGSWEYSSFAKWLEERRKADEQRYKYSGDCSKDNPQAPVDVLIKAADIAKKDEAKKRRRALEAEYSRRKRARKKVEIEVTREQIQRLQRQNQELRSTGRRLETLLQQAQIEVQRHAASHVAQNSIPSSASPLDTQTSLANALLAQQHLQLASQVQAHNLLLVDALQRQQERERLLQAVMLLDQQAQAARVAMAASSANLLPSLSVQHTAVPQVPLSYPPAPAQSASSLEATSEDQLAASNSPPKGRRSSN